MKAWRIALAGLAVVIAAPTAHAAPKPQITDPKGDHPVGGADIVSVTFSTVPKGAKELLQIELVLAEAIDTTRPFSYSVNFVAGDCSFGAIYYNHPFEGVFSRSGVGCRTGGTSLPEGTVKASGTKVTWTVPLAGKVKRGTVLEELAAATTPTGMVSGGVLNTAGDTAKSDATWTVGSDRPRRR